MKNIRIVDITAYRRITRDMDVYLAEQDVNYRPEDRSAARELHIAAYTAEYYLANLDLAALKNIIAENITAKENNIEFNIDLDDDGKIRGVIYIAKKSSEICRRARISLPDVSNLAAAEYLIYPGRDEIADIYAKYHEKEEKK